MSRIMRKMGLAVALIFWFVQTVHGAVLLDRVVAVVNKEVITWSELYKMMESETTDKMKALDEEQRRKVFKENEALFLDKLIDIKLQILEARKVGLSVSAEEVKEAVENIKKKYSLTDASLEESLKKEGMTLEEYKTKLSEQILLSQFVNQQIRSKIMVSDEEVKRFMLAHKEEFADGDGESFKLRQILLRSPKDESGKKAIEDRASLIMQRLKSGEDFSKVAKEYSEDPAGRLGGDTGYIKKNYMAKEFIEVISGMNPGEISRSFWTEKGLHIIKLDEKVPARSPDETRQSIKRRLADEQFLEKYESYVKGLREKARIEIRL